MKFKKILLFMLIVFLSSVNLKAEQVNIERALKTALAKNEDLKIASQDLENSKYKYDEAFSGALPKITGDITYLNRLWVSEEKFDPSIKENTLSTELKVVQPIWLGGKVGTALDIAKVYEKLSKQQYQLSSDKVIMNTKIAFYNILLAKEALRVINLVKKDADENFVRIKNMQKNGLVSDYDLIKAKVRVNGLEPEIEAIKNGKILAEDNLKSIMGIDFDEKIDFVDKLPKFQEFKMANYRQIALQNRKELKLLEYQIEMYQLNKKIKFSNHLPNIVALGSWSHAGTANDLGDTFDKDLTLRKLNVGINISIPIFSGGETTAQVDQAKVDVKKAQLNLSKAQRNIELQVQMIVDNIKRNIKEIKLQEQTITEAEKSLKIANVRYDSGLGTQLEVIDAQTELQKVELAKIQALNKYVVNKVKLDYAIGIIK